MMLTPRHRARSTVLFFFFLVSVSPAAAEPTSFGFRITFDRKMSEAPFTGRVFVMLSKEPTKELPREPNWFKPLPFFAKDVKAWKPGEGISMGSDCLSYPEPLSKLPAGVYYAQAIMDFGRGQSFAASEGNGYSEAVRFDRGMSSAPVSLNIDRAFHEPPFREHDRIKLADIESRLLSSFQGHGVRLRAAVILPKSYANSPEKKYPVVYSIPGFGGSHLVAGLNPAMAEKFAEMAGVERLYVVLDPRCPLGHHVFADSQNNGPWGRALTEELIPYIEKEFRAIGEPSARFVTGHSSGGWSSLWLQITYPDFFGGVWSTAPDPVDFHAMQTIDIYKPGANLFWDEAHKPHPVARVGGRSILSAKPFSDMEVVMGHGGQLGSFEAVFSPRGEDGNPKKLWNRQTGDIDPEVAKSWERYDIRLILERNWKTLGPELAGKLHVYCGGDDTFFLEGAVIALKKTLAVLGSDAVVEILPERDHGSLLDQPMRQRLAREMAQQFQKYYRQPGNR
jgi:S-formylglutathione hydrolase FrmB